MPPTSRWQTPHLTSHADNSPSGQANSSHCSTNTTQYLCVPQGWAINEPLRSIEYPGHNPPRTTGHNRSHQLLLKQLSHQIPWNCHASSLSWDETPLHWHRQLSSWTTNKRNRYRYSDNPPEQPLQDLLDYSVFCHVPSQPVLSQEALTTKPLYHKRTTNKEPELYHKRVSPDGGRAVPSFNWFSSKPIQCIQKIDRRGD